LTINLIVDLGNTILNGTTQAISQVIHQQPFVSQGVT